MTLITMASSYRLRTAPAGNQDRFMDSRNGYSQCRVEASRPNTSLRDATPTTRILSLSFRRREMPNGRSCARLGRSPERPG